MMLVLQHAAKHPVTLATVTGYYAHLPPSNHKAGHATVTEHVGALCCAAAGNEAMTQSCVQLQSKAKAKFLLPP
jgi:hypothetical protein